jgi:hypothetical protein
MMCSRPSGGFAARGRCGQRPLDVTGEKLDARSRALVATTTGFALHAPQILRKSLDGEAWSPGENPAHRSVDSTRADPHSADTGGGTCAAGAAGPVR